ncbi:MAG: polysaccharide biosynthesis tyrosine autokinase, partial [Planctomycetota bacterium]|nr:polysaccharide biosynthesis tyrosine autokinase [Planctomycetota bacterium]
MTSDTPPRFNAPFGENGNNGPSISLPVLQSGALPGSGSYRDRLKVIKARKWQILAVLFLVTLATALMTFRETPIYEATCVLLIEPKKVNVSGVQGSWDPAMAVGNNYYGTQFELLRSRRVAARALLAVDNKTTTSTPETTEELIQRVGPGEIATFRSQILVYPVTGSRLVHVSFRDPDPSRAARAANSTVDAFIRDTRERALGLTDEGLSSLTKQEAEKKSALLHTQKRIEEVRRDSRLAGFAGQELALSRQMEVLSQSLAQARARRVQIGALKMANDDLIQSGHSRRSIIAFKESSALSDLRTELFRVEAEWADLLRRYHRNHPYLKPYEAKLSYLRDALAEEELLVISRQRSQFRAAQSEEHALEQEVEKLEVFVTNINEEGRELNELRERESKLKATLKTIRDRIETINFAVASDIEEQNLFKIDAAEVPKNPIHPQTRQSIAVGALMGLVTGIAFAFFLEFLDNTVKGKEEVQKDLNLPVLGYVPRVSAFVGNRSRPPDPNRNDNFIFAELVALHNAGARVAEAFRSIRTGLGFTLPPGPQCILITSASPADGKSFIATNLALSIVRTGKRVLLLDGDLRNPCLHKIMGISPNEGLSTALSAEHLDNISPYIQPSIVEGLDLLPAGPCPPNPTELLQSERMSRILQTMNKKYDWIVVDAPPMNPVADPAVLLSHVHHALFVVRAFKTTRKGAKRAAETLATTPSQVLGVIMNNVDVPPSRDESHEGYPYYYYYGYGYGNYGDYRYGRRYGS